MAMGPERSKPPLHNFTLPCGLKWGNQKFLRCAKVDSNGEISAVHRRSYGSSEASARRRVQPPAAATAQRRGSNERVQETCVAKRARVGESGGRKFGSDVDNGIAAVREKLMFDLQKAADKMKDAIFREGLEDEESRRVVAVDVDVDVEVGEPSPPPAAAAAAASFSPILASTTVIPVPPSQTTAADSARPWNLRTRRSACKTPTGFPADAGGSSRGLNIDVTNPNVSPSRTTDNKSPRLRSGTVVGAATAGASSSGEKRDRAKFSVPLAKREIEEDFMAILGQRPPRRPKKRPKLVQRSLDTLFPGLWLSEITPDLYKVPDDHSK
ncbi:PREDICTED: uncharacterized protein LOC109156702 [Ipomoea nil]|uniref:uncharacterized protein LOC109156702 n=1 Tax=Ipomoea nil TaxID=35883 RepID=UPI000901B073|nr:PREDICTED: uncharacterized protein LOC109156702 [Ipomoea nil]